MIWEVDHERHPLKIASVRHSLVEQMYRFDLAVVPNRIQPPLHISLLMNHKYLPNKRDILADPVDKQAVSCFVLIRR